MDSFHLITCLIIAYRLLQFIYHLFCCCCCIFFLNFSLFVRSDYLRISDGRDRIVGTYCGYQTGKSLRVVGRTAVLKFVSNQVVRYHGFSLSFIFTPKGKFSNASTASYILTFCGRPAKPRQLLSIRLSRPMAWVN